MVQKLTVYRERDLGEKGFDIEELFAIALTENIHVDIGEWK